MLTTAVDTMARLLRTTPGQGAIIAAFLAAPWLHHGVNTADYEPLLAYAAEAQSDANTDAIQRLFGEIRTSMSDYLFLKTEQYLHSGIRYVNHSGVDEEAAKHEHNHAHNATCGHGDAEPEHGPAIPTLIRPPADDWRGLIGDIQREISPWMDPKTHIKHAKGTQLLPLYRMMTLSNPHRIRGYRLGVMWLLAENDDATLPVALQFLDEGLAHNPDSFELHMMKARVLLRQDRLEDALASLRQAVEHGIRQRPAGGWKLDGVDKERENSLGSAIRTEVFVLKRLNRIAEARQRALEGLRMYGEDPVLRETLAELEALPSS